MKKSDSDFYALTWNEAEADAALSPSKREHKAVCRELIECFMAKFGTHTLTMPAVAIGLRTNAATLRRYFGSLEILLADIMNRHLQAISALLANIPPDDPQVLQLRRAAYLAYTRTPDGRFTETHRILLRDRNCLPKNVAETIEQTRQAHAKLLGGKLAAEALCLIEIESMTPARLEPMLIPAPEPPAPRPPDTTLH